MPSGTMLNASSDNKVLFDAPRPAVTNRLGKKRTDELIQADGDTWQEYLAVCEKPDTKPTNPAPRLSFLGKLNKKKGSKSASASAANSNSNSNFNSNSNSNKGVNLTIRSYFQNQRTGKKVWDEPPSGASNIVPASEEMRRMAEMQLSELYVATSAIGASNTGIGDSGAECVRRYEQKKKKSVSGGLFQRENQPVRGRTDTIGNGDKPKGHVDREAGSSASGNSGRRIRYKPGSVLADAAGQSSEANVRPRGSSFNDRQLQQAIALSIVESQGGCIDRNRRAETEDEILRRVLEESKREAMAASKSPYNTSRKPVEREVVRRSFRKSTKSATSTTSTASFARKHPPPPAVITTMTPAASEPFNPYGPSRKPAPVHKQDRRDSRHQQQALFQDLSLPSASRTRSSGSGRNHSSPRSGSRKKVSDRVGIL